VARPSPTEHGRPVPPEVQSLDRNTPVTVRSSGLNSQDIFFQSLTVGVAIAAVVRIELVSLPPRDEWQRPVALIASLAFIVLVDATASNRIHIREIKIDSYGVTFVFLFHEERAIWLELSAGQFKARFGEWGVNRRWTDSRGTIHTRRIPLTVEQSRGLLRYPGRPKWVISASVANSLGVPPD
jgi:hypothetical protein